jgi:hypothetical protein
MKRIVKVSVCKEKYAVLLGKAVAVFSFPYKAGKTVCLWTLTE